MINVCSGCVPGYARFNWKVKMKAIKVSVRKVVELALRCGDIDSRYTDAADAMLKGAAAHRKLQKQYDSTYQKEVSLSFETRIQDIPVVLQGRADGISVDAGGNILIDEIKTTTLPMDYIFSQREQHLGQVKCYAYMYANTLPDKPEFITVQLTYYQLDSEEQQQHQWRLSMDELAAFFADMMQKYGVWVRYERDWKVLRDSSIQETGFPFDTYRRGQRELAVAAYRTIQRQQKLYAQAPTGIGKTLSSVFPAVKAMGEGKTEKLFYLTAKTVTRVVAENAVKLMAEKGLRFKSVTLRAKDKICLKETTGCNPDYCEYAKGHYDRINEALLDLLGDNDVITPDLIEQYAEKHRVCPHEMALDAALWVDMVIGDYNHVFDPVVYLKRFFNDKGGEYTFLIDEAHNLADRVRDMYTAELCKKDFYDIKKQLKGKKSHTAKLRGTLNKINSHFIDVRKKMETDNLKQRAMPEKDTLLDVMAEQFSLCAGEWLAAEQYTAHELYEDVLALFFQVRFFLLVGELYSERYCNLIELRGHGITITYYCLDPSQIIAGCLERAKSSVFFSATLTPLGYYKEILGGDEDSLQLQLPSPFSQENLILGAYTGISTKYRDREESYQPIARAIYSALQYKRGNYFVFFPSYDFMQRVYDNFMAEYPEVQTTMQTKEMDENARAAFLEQFDSANTGTLLGFCVLGGIFSEGIDLEGDRLIGTVIVGVGLPKISFRQELIREYYNTKNGFGYDYAYVYPGMNKVMQAAGRVIRSEADKGLVLLLDSRFGTQKYRRLYPAHWSHIKQLYREEEIAGLF